MKTIKLKHYADASHGWTKVSVQLIKELGIEHRISGYSYLSDTLKNAYLEEDRDAQILTEALKNKGIPFEYQYINGPDRSHIRYYDTFLPERI